MYLNGSNKIAKSMNGILVVDATRINAKTASITTLNNVENINGKVGEDIIISADSGNIQFNGDVSMNDNLNLPSGDIDVTGDIYIRSSLNPSVNVFRMHQEVSTLYGFVMELLSQNQIMYFRVRDGANNVKEFYFSANQLYSSIYMFVDNNMSVNYGRKLCLGDYNNGNPFGGNLSFIFSSGPTDGLIINCTGVPTGQAYHTNFYSNDASNVSKNTFRLFHNQLTSLVPHVFNSTISVTGSSSFSGSSQFTGLITSFAGIVNNANIHTMTFDCSGNAIFNGPVGCNSTATLKATTATSLIVSGSTTCNGGLTSDSLSVLNNATFNSNVNFIGTTNFIGPATFSNTIDCGYISGDSMLLTGDIDAGSITLASDVTAYGNIHATGNFNTFGGTQFSGAITANANITCDHNIIQNSGIVTNNKITQTRIYGDTIGNANTLKYTLIRYNSGSNTSNPALRLIDDSTGASLDMIPNCNGGSYNPMVQTNDRVIQSVYGTGAGSALYLSSFGPTTKHGLRIYHNTALTNTNTDITEDKYTFNMNNVNAMTLSTTDASGNVSLCNMLSSGSRGITHFPNSNASTSNTFVLASEAVISTNTQNNSSLVLTTSNSAYSYGIRLASTASTNGTITIQSGPTNSVVLNSTNTTINGPLSLANNLTFSDATIQTTAFNSTALGYTKSGTTYTYPTASIIDVTSGGSVLNEIKTHHFNCYGYVEYSDGSVQYTGYTAAKDTKLTAIGTVTNGTMTATTALVANVFFNCGSMTLSQGTYVVTSNVGMTFNPSTNIGQILSSISTSSTTLTSNAYLNIDNKNSGLFGGGQFCYPTTSIVSPASSTTYYLLLQVGFSGGMSFSSGTSSFTAVKIA